MLSQIAHLPNYDRELSAKLLSIFTDPFWYDSNYGFQLQPHILFEVATPSSTFMILWTRTLVGFPDICGAWANHQLEESIKSIGQTVTMYHDGLLGRQVWDTYAIMLASPRVALKLKMLILEQTRHSYIGFKTTLQMLFPLVKELAQTTRNRSDNMDPVTYLLICAAERKMKLTPAQISWLRANTTDSDLHQRIKDLLQASDHLLCSQDIFCSLCLRKCTRPQLCSR